MKNTRRALAILAITLIVMGVAATLRSATQAALLPNEPPDVRRAYDAETGNLSFIGASPDAPIVVPAAEGQGLAPQDRASALLSAYGPEFGLSNPGQQLQMVATRKSAQDRQYTRYQQVHEGVPILGGELVLNTTAQGNLLSLSGEVSTDLTLSTEPSLTAEQARNIALEAVAKSYGLTSADFAATDPELWIFDEHLLVPSTRPAELVWRMDVQATGGQPIDELVLVNAQRGGVSLHFNQIDTEWVSAPGPQDEPPGGDSESPTPTDEPTDEATGDATEESTDTPTDDPTDEATEEVTETPTDEVTGEPTEEATDEPTATETATPDPSPTPTETPASYERGPILPGIGGSPLIETYDAENGTTLPGTFLCNQTTPDCTSGTDSHADAAHAYALDTYDFYWTQHGRDSIDDAGMTIVSSVHYDTSYANAYWSGSQMVYGDAYGFPLADDVVGHELTHGVTENTSDLFYYYQSGAISESFSDVWGEFVDQTNGAGNDDPSVKWLLGEDVSGAGANRDMADPTTFGHPDKMTSSYYVTASADLFNPFTDNGWVHYNSGVNNKAAYLMTDGGSFNGYNVSPLGIPKVAAIYYETQTSLLTSGADYADLYEALFQGCLHLIGGAEGITANDCLEVRDATNAVEMNLEPTSGYNSEAEICPEGEEPNDLFFDDMESGTSNWTFGALTGSSQWGVASSYDSYAHSGVEALWGDDSTYEDPSDTFAAMNTDVTLPANAYLHFAHAFGFEDTGEFFDGGFIEYSIDGGSNWDDVDNAGLFDIGAYAGTIYDDETEPPIPYPNPNEGRDAFVGDSHGYVATRLDLSSLEGEDVRFRWHISMDGYVFDRGWYVDDVRIYTCVTAGEFALWVDEQNTSGPWNGTETYPFQTIEQALTYAIANDLGGATINIRTGTYDETVVVPLGGMSFNGVSGATNTTICNASVPVFQVTGPAVTETVLNGLTIVSPCPP